MKLSEVGNHELSVVRIKEKDFLHLFDVQMSKLVIFTFGKFLSHFSSSFDSFVFDAFHVEMNISTFFGEIADEFIHEFRIDSWKSENDLRFQMINNHTLETFSFIEIDVDEFGLFSQDTKDVLFLVEEMFELFSLPFPCHATFILSFDCMFNIIF